MKPKLLIVEDDATSTEIIRINLNSKGYDLAFAKDGKAAYEIALQYLPDIILMDVKMPGWNGFETCKVFKLDKILCNIPIIFVTAAINDIEKAYSAGGVDYIVKPLRPTELHMRIAFHLERVNFIKEIKQLNIDFSKTIQQQSAQLASTNRKLTEALAELKVLKEQ